jgi:hypothetical protein
VADRLARQAISLMLSFGLSIPLFFVTTYAWLLWIATPLLFPLLRRLQHRDEPRTDPG